MIGSSRAWLARLSALVCLLLPVAAFAGDEVPYLSWDQGYLLQTGLSLAAIPMPLG